MPAGIMLSVHILPQALLVAERLSMPPGVTCSKLVLRSYELRLYLQTKGDAEKMANS